MQITDTDELAAALAEFQAEMPVVPKTHKVTVRTDKGSYDYTYADLADVSAAAMPLLAKHGLSFTCLPRDGMLIGVLMHSSGQSLEGSLPIEGRNPQALGGAITYMRRYLLGCMTGVVTDDDDDGRLASAPAPRKAPAKRAEKPAHAAAERAMDPTPPAAGFDAASGQPVLPPDAPIQASTGNRMLELMDVLKVPEPERLPGVVHIIGRQIGVLMELTEAEGRQVVDKLEQRTRPQGRPVTRPQIRMLMAAVTKLAGGQITDEQRFALAAQIIGRPVDSYSNLTTDEASKIIDAVSAASSLEDLGGTS